MAGIARNINMSPLMNVLIKIVQKASRNLTRDFGELENLQSTKKNLSTFIEMAEQKTLSLLVEELQQVRPEFGIRGEGLDHEIPSKNDKYFLIDPIDGTTNFSRAIPHFALSIALVEGPTVLAGVIYDPIKDELFYAEKGGGAFLNQRRLRVSTVDQLSDAVCMIEIPGSKHGDYAFHRKMSEGLLPLLGHARRSGAIALDLAYVAAGRADLALFPETRAHDIAAGILMIQEAGGSCINFTKGKANINATNLIAGNVSFVQDIQKVLL